MTNPQGPWIDFPLKKEMMDHLRNAIDNSVLRPETDVNIIFAGNISKSSFIEDKDDLFREGVLNAASEHMYYKDWNNYYDVHVAKSVPPPVFELKELWVNCQKQHEFNPPHNHRGLYSFVVFMKIPTHWKEQHALPFSANSNDPCASNFQYLLGQPQGVVQIFNIPLSPKSEGRMLFFPAWLSHQVFPFYGTDEERITISGNIVLQQEEGLKTEEELEFLFEHHEKQSRSIRMMINKKNKSNK